MFHGKRLSLGLSLGQVLFSAAPTAQVHEDVWAGTEPCLDFGEHHQNVTETEGVEA